MNVADQEDAELQAALLMSTQTATTAEEGAAEVAEGKDGTAMDVEEDQPAGDKAEDAEMVLPPVNESVLAELMSMGFPDVRARKALMSGCSDASNALDWIMTHQEDPDIDDP